MSHRIHNQARTTPKIREEIQASALSERQLAKKYAITRSTARKWKNRDNSADRSHKAQTYHTTLTELEEAVVVNLRATLFLSLDDLTYIAKTYLNPKASRSGVNRCLVRNGLSRLKDLMSQVEDETEAPKKSFKDYEPGFLHMDIKYLPKMPDEDRRRYFGNCSCIALRRSTGSVTRVERCTTTPA